MRSYGERSHLWAGGPSPGSRPIPWIWLASKEKLAGRRPYRTLWLVGFIFWLGELYFLTLPYWATSFGWIALAAYMASYLPLFIGLTRVAVRAGRIPVLLAAPVVWVGLECARAHIAGGFAMANLSHTQYRWITLIQFSDLVGAYGVSFLIILVAASLARAIEPKPRRTLWPLALAGVAIGAALVYGRARLAAEHSEPGPTIALIQGSFDVDFNPPPDRREKMYEQYVGLSQQAVREKKDVDLILWPESMFFLLLADLRP